MGFAKYRFRVAAVAAVAVSFVIIASVSVVLLIGNSLSEAVKRPAGNPPVDLLLNSVEFASESGGKVRGWLHKPENPRAAVLLLHGVRASRHSMIGRARFLTTAGYGVLLVDLQAHGESDGNRITFGHLESRDVRASVKYLRREIPDVPIGLIGTSLGGAAIVLGRQPVVADAVVLESVYSDVRVAVSNRLQLRFGPAGALLTPLLTSQLGPRLGVSANELRPVERIGQLTVPVLVIAGAEDQRTTVKESRALFDAAREPKEFWLIEGAAHVDFHRFDRMRYERRVLRFLDTQFSRRETGAFNRATTQAWASPGFQSD